MGMDTLGIDDDPRVVGPDIQLDIPRWAESRKAQQPHPKLVALMPLMFRTLDALYLETRKLPIVGRSGANKNKVKNKLDVFTLGLNLPAREYATLRSILALAGDLALVSDQLKPLRQPPALGQFIKPLNERAAKFHDARNLFSHMEEALRDYSKQGISGPVRLDCGVRFGPNAKNNVYVIWDNDILYFSFENKQRKIVIDKPAFDEIFNQARLLYAEIINNQVSQQSVKVKKADQIYPLN